ncbi:MAG: hypothetical protein AAF411_10205 [Myxococcota bacterium]
MRTAILVLGLHLFACGNGGETLTFDVRVVNAQGQSPFAGQAFEQLEIEVAQQGAEVVRFSGDALDFDFGAIVRSPAAQTRLRLRLLQTGGPTFVGSVPPFSPLASMGGLDLVVGAAGSCVELPALRANAGASVVRLGTFALVAEANGALVAWDLLTMDDLPLTLDLGGPGQIVGLGDREVVLLGVRTEIFNLELGETRPVALHAGAGAESAALRLSTGEALIVGPGPAYSIVTPAGEVRMGTLQSAHARAALVETSAGLFVAGPGEPFVETIESDLELSLALPFGETPVDAMPLSSDFLLVADDGESVRVRCAASCAVEDHPALPSGRSFGELRAGDELGRIDNEGVLRGLSSGVSAPVTGAFALESEMVFGIGSTGSFICFPNDLAPL